MYFCFPRIAACLWIPKLNLWKRLEKEPKNYEMRKLQFHFYVCLICKNFDWKHHFCIFTFIFTNYPDCINRWTNILHLYFLSPKRDDWFGYNIVKQTNEIFWVQYSRFVHMTFNQSLRGWSFRSGALDRACHGRSLCLFFRSFFLHFYKSATYCIFFFSLYK